MNIKCRLGVHTPIVKFYKIEKGDPAEECLELLRRRTLIPFLAPPPYGDGVVATWATDYVGCEVLCKKCHVVLGKFSRELANVPKRVYTYGNLV